MSPGNRFSSKITRQLFRYHWDFVTNLNVEVVIYFRSKNSKGREENGVTMFTKLPHWQKTLRMVRNIWHSDVLSKKWSGRQIQTVKCAASERFGSQRRAQLSKVEYYGQLGKSTTAVPQKPTACGLFERKRQTNTANECITPFSIFWFAVTYAAQVILAQSGHTLAASWDVRG